MPKQGLGVPVKILHEAEGHMVTIETTDGTTYRGFLIQMEDSMNCRLRQPLVISAEGQRTQMHEVFLRGSKIRFFVLPDMMKHAPMIKQLDKKTADRGGGVGYAGKDAGKRHKAFRPQTPAVPQNGR